MSMYDDITKVPSSALDTTYTYRVPKAAVLRVTSATKTPMITVSATCRIRSMLDGNGLACIMSTSMSTARQEMHPTTKASTVTESSASARSLCARALPKSHAVALRRAGTVAASPVGVRVPTELALRVRGKGVVLSKLAGCGVGVAIPPSGESVHRRMADNTTGTRRVQAFSRAHVTCRDSTSPLIPIEFYVPVGAYFYRPI